jgi:hypothetical protein
LNQKDLEFKMNMKLRKIAISSALLSLSASTLAFDTQLTGTFSTITNVAIAQVTPMVFNGLQPASGSSCTMLTPTLANGFPGETVMQLSAVASTPGPSSDIGDMSGAGCSTSVDGTPGIFRITGAAGATVTVSLTPATELGITYTPAGCASDYTGAADSDTCASITSTGDETIVLASVGDQTVSAGNGVPVAGESMLALAGSVSSAIGLSAATPYVINFDITVSY